MKKNQLLCTILGFFLVSPPIAAMEDRSETNLEPKCMQVRNKVSQKLCNSEDKELLLTWVELLLADQLYSEALVPLQHAVKLGDRGAMLYLARMYKMGNGVEENEKKALNFLNEFRSATVLLAGKYAKSDEYEKSSEKAMALLEESLIPDIGEFSDLIDSVSYEKAIGLYSGLANMHQNGSGIPKDVKKAERMKENVLESILSRSSSSFIIFNPSLFI